MGDIVREDRADLCLPGGNGLALPGSAGPRKPNIVHGWMEGARGSPRLRVATPSQPCASSGAPFRHRPPWTPLEVVVSLSGRPVATGQWSPTVSTGSHRGTAPRSTRNILAGARLLFPETRLFLVRGPETLDRERITVPDGRRTRARSVVRSESIHSVSHNGMTGPGAPKCNLDV